MALQVWLPLNGNLKNKGVADITITNNGATVNSSGKIGQCYKFTPNSSHTGQQIIINENLSQLGINDGQSFSFACWIKQTDNNYSNGSGLIASNQYKARGVGLYIKTNRQFDFMMCSADSEVEWTPSNAQITMNEWYHVCATYDSETKTQKFYLNGNFCSQNTISINYVIYNGTISIGQGTQGGWTYTFPGYMNDIRIYDYCLSAAEIKEISRGLILHYKLNIIEPNILGNNGNIISGSDASGITRTYMSDGSVKFEVSSGNSNYSSCLCSQNDKNNFGEKLKAGDEITVSCDLFIESGSGIPQVFLNQGNSYMRLQGNSTLIGKWQRVYYNRTLSEFGTQYGNLSWHFGWSGLSGVFYVKHLKIERHATSNPIFTSDTEITKIIDDSGYGHHGSVTGSLFTNLETPRYNKCLDFESSKITSENLNLSGDSVFTISCWIKLLESKTYQPIFWIGDGTTGHGICAHGNGAGRLEGGDGTNKFDKNLINVGLNTWTHIAIVYNGTEIKQYLNGVLSNNFVSYTYGFGNTLTRLYIGYFWGGYCSSDISDFRIYSTALSADDILQLYQVSAKIDNLGNIHEYELIEEANSQPKVLKTGEIKSNKFVELYNFLYLPTGSFVLSGLTYENGDTCKAETVIRYASGGSGRDLMGYSGSGGGYWGVTANGAWEPHGTFSYTNSDITVPNLISYQFSSDTEHGEYRIGALGSSYTVRNKYIYNVKLYKNGILERDLYPAKSGSSIGLFDVKNGQFYAANNSNATLGQDDETYIAKFYPEHIKGTQFIEI